MFLVVFGLFSELLTALALLSTAQQLLWQGMLVVGGVTGLLGGLVGTLFGGGAKYLQHYVLRFLLWRSSPFPWSAVPLLEEAADCILLQRVGGGYRFIHPLLQEHFASLDVEAMLKQDTGQTKSSM